jgi:hyperosmotically inducible protein
MSQSVPCSRSAALRLARPVALAGAALALVLLACGESDREAALREASSQLEAAKQEVEQKQELVDRKRDAVEAAREELEKASGALEKARDRLAAAQERVGEYATDAVLFRSVQRRLLEDEKLERVAIAARVENGVVNLSGTVPSAKLRDRAVEVAKKTSGVVRVDSNIQVAGGAGQQASGE